MKPYVALLRAVNVSGQNRLPMAALRAELSTRYDHVTTYVQSGNVVLMAAATPEAKLSRSLEQDIRRAFGLSITVLVRTKEQLRAITTHNPFLTRGVEPARLHVTFLADKPSARQVQDLMAKISGIDEAVVRGREIYVHCPSGYGRTKLNNAFLERQLGAKATTRNWATVTKLLALASDRRDPTSALLGPTDRRRSDPGWLDPPVSRLSAMTDPPTTPRVAPAAPSDLDDAAQELLAGATPTGSRAANIFATLVRHPGLFRRWLPFGGKLLAGKLPARDRELLILRTGWRCRSEYEWGQHTLIGRAAGLTDTEIRGIQQGPDEPDWDDFDAVLVRAADELHDDSCLSDETWDALAARYDERQLIEVPMLVGHYHMVAFALNSLGVQREPGVPGFDG